MLESRLKLYKYPVFFVFLSFWAGLYASQWGLYAVIGFFFMALLLRYVFGHDFLYTFVFFVAGFLYGDQKVWTEKYEGRIAVTATVQRRGVIKVDSVIGGDVRILGKKIRIKGLSGFERGDVVKTLMYVKRVKNVLYGEPIKIKKTGIKKGFPYSVNRYLKEKIEELSDKKDIRGFLLGVLLGYRDFISKDLMENFKKTGTMHILALSGLHVGILMALIYLLFIPLTGHRNRAFLISAVLTFLYMVIVGTAPSILRAYIVFVVIMLSRMLKRRTSIYNAIGIAGLFSLLIWPTWAFSYSFILSYLALVGVLYYNSVLSVKNRYLSILFASIGAVLFTLPITSYFAGYVPVLGFIFNLVVIPFFSVLMWILAGSLLFYLIVPFALPLIMFVVNTSGRMFLGIISIFSSISPLIRVRMHAPADIVFYYLVILSLPVIITVLKEKIKARSILITKEVSDESS